MYPVIFQPIYYKYSVCNAIYNNNFTTESLNQTTTIIMCSLQIVVLNHNQVCNCNIISYQVQQTVRQLSSKCHQCVRSRTQLSIHLQIQLICNHTSYKYTVIFTVQQIIFIYYSNQFHCSAKYIQVLVRCVFNQ